MMWDHFVDDELNSQKDKDELLQNLYQKMFAVAYARTKNKSDALDIVQESWVKILHKIDTLHDRDKLFEWAKTIVNNTAINMLKKNSKEVTACHEALENMYHISDEHLEDRIAVNEIYECIQKLDMETRMVFIYKFTYGWKDQQIADKLNLPVGTVKAKLSRGKQRLRRILKKIYDPR